MMFRKVIGYRHIATMLANSSALYVRFKSIEIINVRIHKHKTLQQEFSQYLYRIDPSDTSPYRIQKRSSVVGI